jgi:hypothetical protein
MGFCSIAEVEHNFPNFQPNLATGPSDDDIQEWIDNRAGRIIGLFFSRGIDLIAIQASPGFTDAQNELLRGMNLDGAIADLGDALQGNVTLQYQEYALIQGHRKSFEQAMKEIGQGFFDKMFNPLARTESVLPGFGGGSGTTGFPAGTTETTTVTATDRFFWKSQTF